MSPWRNVWQPLLAILAFAALMAAIAAWIRWDHSRDGIHGEGATQCSRVAWAIRMEIVRVQMEEMRQGVKEAECAACYSKGQADLARALRDEVRKLPKKAGTQ